MHPEPTNVGQPGAPATQPPSAQPTTSRPSPTEVAAFRAAQSANDRVAGLSNQLNQLTSLVRGVVTSQAAATQAASDEQFYTRLGEQLADGTIDQTSHTRQIAERAAAARVAAIAPPATPQPQAQPQPRPDPQAAARQTQEIGARAILLGLGLQGNEPGLDFSGPRQLQITGQQVLAAAGRTAPATAPQGGLDVNQAMGELARQQGFVIPHTDGGHPAAAAQPVGEADLHKITTDRKNRNAPRRMIAALQDARDAMAAQVGTLQTGEGLLGAPSTFRQ